jgi:hypothetical protein
VKYGCHSHKHTGVCRNRLMIRQDRLEEQLLDTIERRILNPSTLDHLIVRCQDELRHRLTEMDRQGSIKTLAALKHDLGDRERRLANVITAIETAGDVSLLANRLREPNSEVESIRKAIDTYRPIKIEAASVRFGSASRKPCLGSRNHSPQEPILITCSAQRMRSQSTSGSLS